MNGNFHFLSLGDVTRVASETPKINLIVSSTIRFIYCISWKRIYENWTFHVALFSILEENTHVFVTFRGKETCFSWNFITFAPNLKHFTTYGKYK